VPELLAALFESGRIIDLILALVAIEGAALILLRRRDPRRGLTAGAALSLLAPGAALMLAVRLALTDAHWRWIALALLAALIAHLADLVRRLEAERRWY